MMFSCYRVLGRLRVAKPVFAAGLMISMMPGVAQATSCYALKETKAVTAFAPQGIARELIVLVDMTTSYPAEVREQAVAEMVRLATPGTRVSIGSFSAYSGSTFPKISTQIYFERGVPKAARSSAPGLGLRILDSCLAQATAKGQQAVRAGLNGLFVAARASVGKSDIMSSLQQFGARFRSSPAPDKIGIVVSDMLENSSSISFYAKGSLRTIDPAAEMKKARSSGVIANLGKSRIYVIGAGLIENDKGMRTAQQMQQLEQFWSGYFAASSARLAGFGKPLLLDQVR